MTSVSNTITGRERLHCTAQIPYMPLIYLQCFNLNVDYRFFLMRYVIIFSGVLLGGKLMDFIFIYTRYTVNPLAWSDCKLVMMSIEKCIVVYFR